VVEHRVADPQVTGSNPVGSFYSGELILDRFSVGDIYKVVVNELSSQSRGDEFCYIIFNKVQLIETSLHVGDSW
jgi:hypothetical protein